jgi:DNA-binding SARP family transcriptional activator
MSALAIHLLGPPRVEIDHHDVPGPRGRKAWGLLAFLLMSRKPASRERLAGLLFGDADDPLATLRWNLAELRRSLGPEVKLGGDPVDLTLPTGAYVDVLTLGSGTWVEAVRVPGLGLGLLEGVDAQVGAAFEAWLLAERRHVAGLSAAVLSEAATARLAAGDARAAVELATRLVSFDEFDEEAHALLIRSYVSCGTVAEAQRHLDATVARFRRELGVDPSSTLTRAIEAAPAAPAGRPRGPMGVGAVESLIAAGQAAVGAGVFEGGLEILRRSVADARETGDRALECRALIALGEAFVHGGRGRDGEGATSLHAAVVIAEEIGEAALVADASRELGYIEMKQARYERAGTWLDRAISVAPDRGSRAAAIAIQGAVASDQGGTARGNELLAGAASDARDLDKPRLEAWALAFLGRNHLLREEWEAARASLERAIDVTRGAGWMTFMAFPQSLLAGVDLAEDRVDAAGAAFEAAFALGCQVGDPCWEGISARGIGLVHRARGRVDESIAWLQDARTRSTRFPDVYLWVNAYCLDALCDVAIDGGAAKARAWVSDLETLAARTGMTELLTRAQLHRAALGDEGAAEAARLFADRIDNPAILDRVGSLDGTVNALKPALAG